MTAPPSGMPPPTTARFGDRDVDLVAIAARICERYREAYPDEEGRYGDAGMAWCRHDNQHILNWAIGAATGLVGLDREISWLANVLHARDFPLDRLAHDLELAAEAVEEELGAEAAAIAASLRESARSVRAR